ncbi:RNA polymerase sigma factor [Cytobacillus purgationiresistens]
MEAFQQGNDEAFGKLYTLIKPSLYAFLFRYTRDEQGSADLVQDTFVKLHRYKNHFQSSKGHATTYIFQMAYHLMITKINRRKKAMKFIPFLVPQPKETIVSHEERITIREALLKLPGEHRALILLSYYHDMPQKEIAEIIDIPIGTVKSRLHHILKTLRKLLEDDEDEQRKTK